MRLTRLAGVPLTDYSNSRSDSLFSGKAELDFHLAPDVLTYVSYNRGVKGGGYNAPLFPAFIVDVNGMTFKPETLTSYEVGVKSEFLDRKLRLNGAAYYYDYKDLQVSVSQLVNNIPTTFSTNAASARIYGADAQLVARVTANLNVNAPASTCESDEACRREHTSEQLQRECAREQAPQPSPRRALLVAEAELHNRCYADCLLPPAMEQLLGHALFGITGKST